MIPLTLATAHYDRTIALATGDVQPDGIDLTYLRMPVEEVFWRMTRHGEFDAAEMSLSSYLLRRSRGDDGLVAIPVFTSRYFRHNNVFVNDGAGIERPEDLRGKRIGVPEYQMTAAVWIRGFLEDDYGVRPTDCTWFRGGRSRPGGPRRSRSRFRGLICGRSARIKRSAACWWRASWMRSSGRGCRLRSTARG